MMATITYGKGKALRPTTLSALRETMERHTRKGAVEMLDVLPDRVDKAVADRSESDHADVRAAKYVLTQIPKGSASSVKTQSSDEKNHRDGTLEKTKPVRVRLHAPGVALFFGPKKHEDLVVLNTEAVPD
jgi:hypothetical protein